MFNQHSNGLSIPPPEHDKFPQIYPSADFKPPTASISLEEEMKYWESLSIEDLDDLLSQLPEDNHEVSEEELEKELLEIIGDEDLSEEDLMIMELEKELKGSAEESIPDLDDEFKTIEREIQQHRASQLPELIKGFRKQRKSLRKEIKGLKSIKQKNNPELTGFSSQDRQAQIDQAIRDSMKNFDELGRIKTAMKQELKALKQKKSNSSKWAKKAKMIAKSIKNISSRSTRA
ncbi:hypothetical protein [Aureibacter tunicatorum]|uniref:Uncharacterized protein n=1 Tax=Aureibacter tunicatorum TaxID=866807 RepID=A0AAE3XLK3_9BACT|nr:hypothetical protein [Aureibacter tunicatorum]MDR6239132.1 hypothetical protein [Aureibacter tunicatorum]BDD04942.1 hypothetical protein AUTU_24250 [Aureibacter tunicatorum]